MLSAVNPERCYFLDPTKINDDTVAKNLLKHLFFFQEDYKDLEVFSPEEFYIVDYKLDGTHRQQILIQLTHVVLRGRKESFLDDVTVDAEAWVLKDEMTGQFVLNRARPDAWARRDKIFDRFFVVDSNRELNDSSSPYHCLGVLKVPLENYENFIFTPSSDHSLCVKVDIRKSPPRFIADDTKFYLSAHQAYTLALQAQDLHAKRPIMFYDTTDRKSMSFFVARHLGMSLNNVFQVIDNPSATHLFGTDNLTDRRLVLATKMMSAMLRLQGKMTLSDIRPSKMTLREGVVYIIGFGVSEAMGQEVREEFSSLHYKAPEYINAHSAMQPYPVSSETAAYSLGLMLFELFGGKIDDPRFVDAPDHIKLRAFIGAAQAPNHYYRSLERKAESLFGFRHDLSIEHLNRLRDMLMSMLQYNIDAPYHGRNVLLDSEGQFSLAPVKQMFEELLLQRRIARNQEDNAPIIRKAYRQASALVSCFEAFNDLDNIVEESFDCRINRLRRLKASIVNCLVQSASGIHQHIIAEMREAFPILITEEEKVEDFNQGSLIFQEMFATLMADISHPLTIMHHAYCTEFLGSLEIRTLVGVTNPPDAEDRLQDVIYQFQLEHQRLLSLQSYLANLARTANKKENDLDQLECFVDQLSELLIPIKRFPISFDGIEALTAKLKRKIDELERRVKIWTARTSISGNYHAGTMFFASPNSPKPLRDMRQDRPQAPVANENEVENGSEEHLVQAFSSISIS